MKPVIFAFIGVAALSILPMQSGDKAEVLRPRSITPGDVCSPTDLFKAVLEVGNSVGASVMVKNYWVQSLEDEDVPCDIVRLSLKNKGSAAIQFTVPTDHQEAPFLHVEGFIDGKWTSTFPIHTESGKIRYIRPVNYRYPARFVTVQPGDQFCFPVHIERWRFSLTPTLRIAFHIGTDKSKETEVVYSNTLSARP